VAACIGGVLGSFYTLRYFDSPQRPYRSIEARQQLVKTNNARDTAFKIPHELDFTEASRIVTAGVVHLRTSYGAGNFSLNPLENYFDSPARSSGSGVIISDDGFIVSNYHVIEDATQIEVVLNNNDRYYAKIIGSDPTTDLALLKINSKNLPFVKYGDSDILQAGEWVLAIGNPFELNSTVTAGIVSAKARNLGILGDRNNLQVESFIQTDAAVNPGNSGGALVNLRGELVGINTAIATSTGGYQGYSFAIPVTLVKKVMDDLLEFGQVQRGLLGVQIEGVTARIAERFDLPVNQGVLVRRVNKGSAAEQSGIVPGDVIIEVADHPVANVSELQERVARHRPGDEIQVTIIHDGDRKELMTRLKNFDGQEDTAKIEVPAELDGAEFEDITYQELARLGIEGGVKVHAVKEGSWKEANIRPDFIITFIDKIMVDNLEDLNRILAMKRGGVLIEGIYPDGEKGVYGLDWE
jgi:Do/DeqQ family serine protease